MSKSLYKIGNIIYSPDCFIVGMIYKVIETENSFYYKIKFEIFKPYTNPHIFDKENWTESRLKSKVIIDKWIIK